MRKREFLSGNHAELLAWYRHCEEKAKFIIAINTALVSVFAGIVFAGGGARMPATAIGNGGVAALLVMLGISVLASLLAVLRVLWARHYVVDTTLPEDMRVWFFGDIAGLSREAYARSIAAIPEDALDARVEAMLTSQVHILATSVMRKHRALNWAIGFTMAAVACQCLLGVLAALHGLAAG